MPRFSRDSHELFYATAYENGRLMAVRVHTEGTTFKAIPITDAQTANLAVATVLPQRSLFSGQERVTVAASVVNRGPAAVNNVQVRLEVDGRAVETQTISVPPGAPASVTFVCQT